MSYTRRAGRLLLRWGGLHPSPPYSNKEKDSTGRSRWCAAAWRRPRYERVGQPAAWAPRAAPRLSPGPRLALCRPRARARPGPLSVRHSLRSYERGHGPRKRSRGKQSKTGFRVSCSAGRACPRRRLRAAPASQMAKITPRQRRHRPAACRAEPGLRRSGPGAEFPGGCPGAAPSAGPAGPPRGSP